MMGGKCINVTQTCLLMEHEMVETTSLKCRYPILIP